MKSFPVLFLRWVNPSEVFDAYHNGKFSNFNISEPKLKVEVNPIMREIYEGAGPQEDRFNFKTREGTEIVVLTDNSALFNMEKNPEPGKVIKIRCGWCRCDFEVTDQRKPVLIPLKVEETSVIRGIQKIQVKIYRGDYPHCDFNCALASILNRRDIPAEAQTYLLNLHARCYPGALLTPAGNPGIIDVNGGNITYAEFKKERNELYREISGIIQQAVKKAFVRI